MNWDYWNKAANMTKNTVSFTLLVNSHESAIEFYVRKLRLFEVESDHGTDSNRLVSLRLKSCCDCFTLVLCEGSTSPELKEPVGCQSGSVTMLTLPVVDISTIEARIAEANIEVIRRYELPYAEYVMIRDPFGNKIDLVEMF